MKAFKNIKTEKNLELKFQKKLLELKKKTN